MTSSSSSSTSINSATHSSVANSNTPATTPSTAAGAVDKSSAVELESKEIGWSFVQYYYNLFSSNPNEVYKLYAPNATVAHDDFDEFLTEEHPALVNVEAKGTEEIRSKIFNFTADKNQDDVKHKFKIVVNSADIYNLNMFGDLKTILIVVVGELARGDSPAFSFAQTFVINQSNKNVYDIVNDVMRIIPLEDENEKEFVAINNEPAVKEVKEDKPANNEDAASNSSPAPAAPAVAATPTPAPAAAPEKEEDSKTPTPAVAPTVKQDAELKSVADKKAGKEDESTATSAADVSTAATSTASTPGKKDEPKFSQDTKQAAYASKKVEEKKLKEASPTKLEKPTSANAASALAEKPTSESESKGPTSWAARAAKKGTEPAKKQVITTPPTPKSSVSKPPTTTTTEPASGKDDGFDLVKNKKIKKSFKLSSAEVYPVYIRGISEKLTTEELTAKLESNFGDVFSCVVKNFVALVDFKTVRAQEQALKTRTLSIDGKFDITIEPRTTKGNDKEGKHFKKDGKPNGKKFVNANNKKPAGKFQKAKKDVEKN